METFFALLALCAGNSPVPGEFLAQRPVTRSFDVFFDLCPNKRLSKQSWGWWLETLSCSLWRHCNAWWKITCINMDQRHQSLKIVASVWKRYADRFYWYFMTECAVCWVEFWSGLGFKCSILRQIAWNNSLLVVVFLLTPRGDIYVKWACIFAILSNIHCHD